jgi:tRNA modification GTPase
MSLSRKLRHWFTPHVSNNFRAKLLHNTGIFALLGIILSLQVFLRLLEHSPLHILGFTSSITIDEVVRATNETRVAAGLPALSYNEKLADAAGYTAHFGRLYDGEEMVDEVIALVFRAPRSFTAEEMVEFTCHGGPVVVGRVLRLMLDNGCRLAEPGEFTRRAFLNGRIDLLQAEAIGEMIHARTESAYRTAVSQMKGDLSKRLGDLREQLIRSCALIELELDFSEEDVEFADRNTLRENLVQLISQIVQLTDSFQYGNVIKQGVPVAIIGKPNVGKSTLLNTLLNEEKAIVSEIPGTTRDIIEDTLNIGGILFRFIDTAGIRHTSDTIESMGIERTLSNVQKATIILYLIDPLDSVDAIREMIATLPLQKQQFMAIVINKTDRLESMEKQKIMDDIRQHFPYPIIPV